jgi:hypothetical protein
LTARAGPRAGRLVVVVDTGTWTYEPFVADRLVRPIDVRFHPIEGTPYIVDFGWFEMQAGGRVSGQAATGALWRATC